MSNIKKDTLSVIKICTEYDGDEDNFSSHKYTLMNMEAFVDFIVNGHVKLVSPALTRTQAFYDCEDELYNYFLNAKKWSEKELLSFAKMLFSRAI